ncbi:MbtH family protein [Serratia rubidaea]|uniref:MbtH family protein n=1 Tax=Serratia rubidaea TaxID=61652 RepID=UPI002430EC53|nr:MbtH family protein [Serratia rubidaea]MCR0997815.1 MbtH family protein [Serratia rubidaea]
MSNPFENEKLVFCVLVNDENQHSLWPEFIQIPSGWKQVFGPEDRQSCINYINENWSDIKPNSLAR